MKLHEMDTETMADVICNISDPVSHIIDDKKIMDGIAKIAEKHDGETVANKVAVIIRTFVPILLKSHREDMFAIVAAMSGKKVNDVRHQPFMDTVMDIKNLADKDLLDFFTQHESAEQTES